MSNIIVVNFKNNKPTVSDPHFKGAKEFWRLRSKNGQILKLSKGTTKHTKRIAMRSKGDTSRLFTDALVEKFTNLDIDAFLHRKPLTKVWVLKVSLDFDSKEYNKIKKSKSGEHKFIRDTALDLNTMFNQLFGLNCNMPNVNNKRRAKNGTKNLYFQWDFKHDSTANNAFYIIAQQQIFEWLLQLKKPQPTWKSIFEPFTD